MPSDAGAAYEDDFAALEADAQKSFSESVTPFVKNYCADCHGDRKMKGGITFSPGLKNPGGAAAAKRWKQAVANVKAHDMPPEDEDKQPTEAERQRFLEGIAKLKYLSPKDPGPFVMRRLIKVEYGNTLHDLFGVDLAVAGELPDEVFEEGYLNTLSPLQSEQYLGIANEVLNRLFTFGDAPSSELLRRLLGDPPARGTDLRVAAQNVARPLARKAYRRPPSEAELEVLLSVFDLAMENNFS